MCVTLISGKVSAQHMTLLWKCRHTCGFQGSWILLWHIDQLPSIVLWVSSHSLCFSVSSTWRSMFFEKMKVFHLWLWPHNLSITSELPTSTDPIYLTLGFFGGKLQYFKIQHFNTLGSWKQRHTHIKSYQPWECVGPEPMLPWLPPVPHLLHERRLPGWTGPVCQPGHPSVGPPSGLRPHGSVGLTPRSARPHFWHSHQTQLKHRVSKTHYLIWKYS